MSTLTKDQWDALTEHIARAKQEINEAARVLCSRLPESPWEKKLDDEVSMAANHLNSAEFWNSLIQNRIREEARKEVVSV